MRTLRVLSVLVLSLSLVAASCTGKQSGVTLAATGESLKTVGVSFETVAKGFKAGCDAKTILKKDCEAFRVFGLKFKESYPLATGLWDSAWKYNDAALQGRARDAVVELATQLTALATQAGVSFGK